MTGPRSRAIWWARSSSISTEAIPRIGMRSYRTFAEAGGSPAPLRNEDAAHGEQGVVLRGGVAVGAAVEDTALPELPYRAPALLHGAGHECVGARLRGAGRAFRTGRRRAGRVERERQVDHRAGRRIEGLALL